MKFLSTAKLTLLLLIAGYSAVHLHSPLMFVRIIVEVFLILALTQILGHKFNSLPIRIIKYILSSLLILFSLIDAIVATFSGTYLTVLMTQNLANIMDLGGNLWLYGSAALLVILAAFLPMRYNLFNKKQQLASIAIFGISLISLNLTATHQTPLFGYVGYFSSYNKMKEISNIKKPKSAQTKIEAEFAKSTIASGISTNLQQPNVIVIFTEGLSQEVLNYDGGKLTPNLNKLKNQTINFSNYYNQTAATYRGVRGQLFSEQQLNQGYENGQDQIKDALNTKLTSVQSILGDQGYQTEFINAEPNQSIWTTYVENLGFDKVTTDKSKSFLKLAGTTFMGDQQNYKFLFNQATELSKENNPFFLADYTFQTHLSLDSSLKYGDGKNSDLNKFYNMDNAFGKFWKKFQKSSLTKNTIVVFTADHASYPDQLYQNTFKTKRTYFVSTIPLMIYVPNMESKTIDANSRNSLGLAPTILDLVGVDKASNYFLGTSLFTNHPTAYEHISTVPPVSYSTAGLTEKDTVENKNIQIGDTPETRKLNDYYSFSLTPTKKTSSVPEAGD